MCHNGGMQSIDIRSLHAVTLAMLRRICGGYTSTTRYRVTHHDDGSTASITLERLVLAEPYGKQFDYTEQHAVNYHSLLGQGFSFGAYTGRQCVGMLIGERLDWNNSLLIWEFHVVAGWQQQGNGRRLMAAAEQAATLAGLRIMVCETQSTNGAAIEVYHRLGFRVEGVDIGYYTNQDYPDGECAVFMKKRLE